MDTSKQGPQARRIAILRSSPLPAVGSGCPNPIRTCSSEMFAFNLEPSSWLIVLIRQRLIMQIRRRVGVLLLYVRTERFGATAQRFFSF